MSERPVNERPLHEELKYAQGCVQAFAVLIRPDVSTSIRW